MSDLNNDNLLAVEGEEISAIASESNQDHLDPKDNSEFVMDKEVEHSSLSEINSFSEEKMIDDTSRPPKNNLESQVPRSQQNNLELQVPRSSKNNLESQEPSSSTNNLESQVPRSPKNNLESQEPRSPTNNLVSQEPRSPKNNLESQEPRSPKNDLESQEPRSPTNHLVSQEPRSPKNNLESQETRLLKNDLESQEPRSPTNNLESQVNSEFFKVSDEEVQSSFTDKNLASKDLSNSHAFGNTLAPMNLSESEQLHPVTTEAESSESTKKNVSPERLLVPKKRLSKRRRALKRGSGLLDNVEQLKVAKDNLKFTNSDPAVKKTESDLITADLIQSTEETDVKISSERTEENSKVMSIESAKDNIDKRVGLSCADKLGKRSASDIDTITNSPKRPKLESHILNLNAARKNLFKVVIVFKGFPEKLISQEQLTQLSRMILRKLDRIKASEKIYPKFDGLYCKRGACIVNCVDEKTKLWLERIVGDLQIGGSFFCSTSLQAVSPLKRVGAFFPGDLIVPDQLLKRIMAQNPQLDTTRWSVSMTKQEKTGFYAFMKIPETSLLQLETQNSSICFGFIDVKVFKLGNKKSQPRLQPRSERKIKKATNKTKKDTVFSKISGNLENYKRDWIPSSEQKGESISQLEKDTVAHQSDTCITSQSRTEGSLNSQGKPFSSQENNSYGIHMRNVENVHWENERPKSSWDSRKLECGLSQNAGGSFSKNNIGFSSDQFHWKHSDCDKDFSSIQKRDIPSPHMEDRFIENRARLKWINPNLQEKAKFPSENSIPWSSSGPLSEKQLAFEEDNRLIFQGEEKMKSKSRWKRGTDKLAISHQENSPEINFHSVNKFVDREHLSSAHYFGESRPRSQSEESFEDKPHQRERTEYRQGISHFGDRSSSYELHNKSRHCYQRKDNSIPEFRYEDSRHSSRSEDSSSNDFNKFHFNKTKRCPTIHNDRPNFQCEDRHDFSFHPRSKHSSPSNVRLDTQYEAGPLSPLDETRYDCDNSVKGGSRFPRKGEDDSQWEHVPSCSSSYPDNKSRFQERDSYVQPYKDQDDRFRFERRVVCVAPQHSDDKDERSHFQRRDKYLSHHKDDQDERSFQERDMYMSQHKYDHGERSRFQERDRHLSHHRDDQDERSIQERDMYMSQHKYDHDERSRFQERDRHLSHHRDDQDERSIQEREIYMSQNKYDHDERSCFRERDRHLSHHRDGQDERFFQERDMYMSQHKYDHNERSLTQDRDRCVSHHKYDQDMRSCLQERDVYEPQYKRHRDEKYNFQGKDMYLPHYKDDQDRRSHFTGRDMYKPHHKESANEDHHKQESRFQERTSQYDHDRVANKQFALQRRSTSNSVDEWKRKITSRRF